MGPTLLGFGVRVKITVVAVAMRFHYNYYRVIQLSFISFQKCKLNITLLGHP